MKQFVIGKIRVQFLSKEIVRLEYCKKNFCDENTFLIPNKSNYANVDVDAQLFGNVVVCGDYAIYVTDGARGLSGIYITKKAQKVYTCKKNDLVNSGELPTPSKTPQVFAVADNPRIIVPEGGYTYRGKKKNSGYKIQENVQDVYLLLCDGDAKKLRQLYVELTGRCELVRLATLGGWNSKYFAYDETTAKKLILDYEKHNVPLDCMVIDTDWRSCEHGWGYDVNKQLFPNIKRFIDFAHSHGVEVMFNDHPEPVDGANVLQSEEVRYREKNLQALMKVGVDTWWYDRNWATSLVFHVRTFPTKHLACMLSAKLPNIFTKNKAETTLFIVVP